MISKIGIIASVLLPLFNIPLILRMVKRKSAEDLSLVWVTGVWLCIVLMTPHALSSPDIAFRLFAGVNLLLFSVVAGLAFWYRWGRRKG